MVDLAAFLVAQAEASTYVQFIYNATSGQVEYVCSAYDHVFSGHAREATAELPALLARIHPDDRNYLANYWRLWVEDRISEDVEVRLLGPDQSPVYPVVLPHALLAAGSRWQRLGWGHAAGHQCGETLSGEFRPLQCAQERHVGNSFA